MNIYVETNFVFELVFAQEQLDSCENIISLCEKGKCQLVLPAYSLVEPHEKLIRQAKYRIDLQQKLDAEIQQLTRNSTINEQVRNIQEINLVMIKSNLEEQQRFESYYDRLLNLSTVIPLTSEILKESAINEKTLSLSPQDAIVFTSISFYLRNNGDTNSCFLNRNWKDFDTQEIKEKLNEYKCKFISHFNDGLDYIQSQI